MKKVAKTAAYLTWFGGVIAVLALVGYFGYGEVAAALAACGWGLLWISVFRLFPLAIDALAWGRLFDEHQRPSFMALLWMRWVGEAANSLLPVAQVGGDVIRGRLAARCGVPRASAAATVVVDYTVGILTQFVFCVVGMGLLLTQRGVDDHTAALTMLTGVAMCGAVVLYTLPKLGLFGMLANFIGKLANGTWQSLAGKVTSLDRAVTQLHEQRWEVLNAMVLKLGAWMARTGETYLALHFLGFPIGVEEAIVIESLISAVRSAAFAIPGALGVQEGGLLLLGALLGMPPETALALALVKRVREIVMGVPALIGWTLLETRVMGRRLTGQRLTGQRLSGSD